MSKPLFQCERNALLLVDVLRSLVRERKFMLHDFVLMPDHIHLLVELDRSITIEKTMQFIKGRFSHRIQQEFGMLGAVWQPGFSEQQIIDDEAMMRCQHYMADNPVKAGLVLQPQDYPFCYKFLVRQKLAAEETQGLKPPGNTGAQWHD